MKDRFNRAFNYLKGEGIIRTQKEASHKIGVAAPNLSNALNGDDRYLTYSFLKRFNQAFDNIFNDQWLLTGEGEMLKRKQVNEVTPVPEGEYMMVEYADLRASAGMLGVGDVSQLPDTHKRLVPKEYAKGKFLIVRVDGDSMDDGSKRSLSDGDEVLIYLNEDGFNNGLPIRKTVFVITTRDGNVLKQIAEINREYEYIVCRSFNSQYEDFRIKFEDIFQIFTVCKVVNRQISLT